MGITGEFAFDSLDNFFQTLRFHAANSTGLFGIPDMFFLIQINMAQFIQFCIFTIPYKIPEQNVFSG